MSKLFHFNALFDLHLGNYQVSPVARSQALAMSHLIAFCGSKEDRNYLEISTTENYWDYLESLDIPYASPLNGPANSSFHLQPWGWDKGEVDFFTNLGVNCEYPNLDIVKKINSRVFTYEISKILHSGVPGSIHCNDIDELYDIVKGVEKTSPFVAKPIFSSSGHGIIKIDETPQCRSILEKMCNYGNGVIVEPWCDRVLDLSSRYTINKDQSMEFLGHYRCDINSFGSFRGVYLFPDDVLLNPWVEKLEHFTEMAISLICKEGYFGPISFDSFVYKNRQGTLELAPIIEINGRMVMSDIARGLKAKIANANYCCFKFVNQKKSSKVDNLHFDKNKTGGIIRLNPSEITYQKQKIVVKRHAYFIYAENLENFKQLENKFFTFEQEG